MKKPHWQTDLEKLLERKKDKLTDDISPKLKLVIKSDIRIIENYLVNMQELLEATEKERAQALETGEKLFIICLQHGISDAAETVNNRSLSYLTKENQEMQQKGEVIIPTELREYLKTKGILNHL